MYDNTVSRIHTWIYKIAENLVKKNYKDEQKMYLISLENNMSDDKKLANKISDHDIRKDDEYNISLSLNNRRISDGMIFWKSRFNKKFFYFETKKMKKDNHDFFIKKSELCDYDLSKSERYMLNTIKDCSLFLINILDCNYGKYSLLTNHSNFIYSLHITLSKNNIK
jgi:hypothetical protein